jgi:uncharacterized membrane protein YfcA
MVLAILIVSLTLAAIALSAFILRAALLAKQLKPSGEAMALGAVTNFFDTLGIGSFAPTLAYLRFRKTVPDRLLPTTMLAGYTPPSILQAVIFLLLLGVHVDPLLLAGSAVAIVCGALVGALIVPHCHVRLVQAVVAGALLTAALFYSLSNLHLMPLGGTATGLPPLLTAVAIALSFGLGILLNFGVGNYAPMLAIVSLFGMDPRLAFPIMATGAGFAGAAASAQMIRSARPDLRIVLGLAIGAIPGVLIAAFVVKQMPIALLRWLVVAVVLYAAGVLIAAAVKREPALTIEQEAIDAR